MSGSGAAGGGAVSWPSVTAVIATRERPELLARAVSAVVAQSYPGELECVVVFDQSDPVPVPADVPDGVSLRLVRNARTPGLAGARNTGITGSAGEFVAFCDDDDEWAPGKLRLQIELLQAAEADFAATGVRIHYADRVVTRIPPESVGHADLVRSRVAELHPSTFVIRRAALDRIGLVDEEIPGSYGEDYDILLRAARERPVVSVPQPLAEVYWHPQSFFAERWESIAQALSYLLGKHPELAGDRAGLARIQGQIAFALAAQGRRPDAWHAGWDTLRQNSRERRAYLALAVASGVIPAGLVVRMANRAGRGI